LENRHAKKNRTLHQVFNAQQISHDLKAAQVLDGQWAVVSNDSGKPLTEAEANRIIAAYLAVNELLKATV
jgi:hypothetical protein